MDAQTASYLRELVFKRQHDRWSQVRHQAGFASNKMLRLLRGGGDAHVEAIILLEHPIVDEDTLLCEGKPSAAWRLNSFGLCDISVSSFERLRAFEGNWPFELVRFAMDLGVEPVVYVNELAAADRGLLTRCQAVRTPRGLDLQVLEKRKFRPAAAATTLEATVNTQAALAFLRGDERTMTA